MSELKMPPIELGAERLSLSDQVTLAMIAHENSGDLRELALAILREARHAPMIIKRGLGADAPDPWKGETVVKVGGQTPLHYKTLVCEPPPEHRDKRWHWLRYAGPRISQVGDKPSPMKWENGRWNNEDCFEYSATDAFAHGWRYVAPCEEPKS